MSKRMYAIFSDEAYNDYMSGAAVDNNGLRSLKGCFYPDQPSFEPINEREEQLIDAGIKLGTAFFFYVVFPEIKRFAHEKVYPFVAEQWDNWQNKQREKRFKKDASNDPDKSEKSNVINLEEYRKMA